MEHLREAWLRGKEVLEEALPARMENDIFTSIFCPQFITLCKSFVDG
jgi:hypothetical protein